MKEIEHNGKKYNITELERKLADIGIKTLGFSGIIYYEDVLFFIHLLLEKSRRENQIKALKVDNS